MRRHRKHRVGGTESLATRDFERNREFHLHPCPFWRNVPYKGRKRHRDAGRIEVSLVIGLLADGNLACRCAPLPLWPLPPLHATTLAASEGRLIRCTVPGSTPNRAVILRWMINGCLEWQKIGLAPPKIVTDATDEYFNDQDTLKQVA
jgi:hypothetical protein